MARVSFPKHGLRVFLVAATMSKREPPAVGLSATLVTRPSRVTGPRRAQNRRGDPAGRTVLTRFFRTLLEDYRYNAGLHIDAFKARALLSEYRTEQLAHSWYAAKPTPARSGLWYLVRFLGSIAQWLLFQSSIPGSASIGAGLRLPHPQNIVIARRTQLGEHCSVYHNVTLARGTYDEGDDVPILGNRVVVGAGAIVIGPIEIGDDAVIAAGTTLASSLPAGHMAVNDRPRIVARKRDKKTGLLPDPPGYRLGGPRHDRR